MPPSPSPSPPSSPKSQYLKPPAVTDPPVHRLFDPEDPEPPLILSPARRTIPLELEELFTPAPLSDAPIRDLMAVNLPYDCLQRFISIGRINTERNRETCGLLLGRQKGKRYVMTTLLIPKQFSTHNACTIEDEVDIAHFAKQRALVTLGWIHTHPTESCFMTSIDLHMQGIFQSVLPEAFAVVCSPKHSPNFRLYRLTDPSGIRTILSCEETNVLHTHPERQLYAPTDHVRIKAAGSMPMEVVDLR
ncbi:hypothetical protein BC834DRAFT_834252 [Gloeopeniophorella convolvens]|nr:hypothetical protein BC834DRAFT_834252 [Gloeopeniophorella convolvens]